MAYVKCKGTCDKIQRQYQYDGIHDCLSAAVVPGSGDKKCRFGCMGYGSCEKACAFDAIHVIDGVAQVDKENVNRVKSVWMLVRNILLKWSLMNLYVM